jgi:transposase
MTNRSRVRALTFRLNTQQRRKLSEQAKQAKNARSVRRAIALLELDQGRPVAEVAATLGVTRQTLYNWRARLEADDVPRALLDRKGRGRRTAWTEPVRRFLDWSMTLPPEELGYASVGWTAAILLRHLETWASMRVSDTTLREQLHRLGYVWKRPRYVLQPDPDRKKKRRIRRQVRALPKGCVLLAEDETDVRLFPPLRAAWTKRGQQAKVWLSGRNALRVIFGAINLRTGHRVLLCRERQYAADFCAFLDDLRRRYRDRPLALLLDADSSHTARASLQRAAELDIRLIWLPTRSPELNPMDHLWRAPKVMRRVSRSIPRPGARWSWVGSTSLPALLGASSCRAIRRRSGA